MFFLSCGFVSRSAITAAIALALPISLVSGLAAQPDAPAAIPGQLESIEISQSGKFTDLVLRLEGGQLSAGALEGEDGQLVIQLGNYLPGPQVKDLSVGEGLISKIEVRPRYRGKRPVTVVAVTTRQPASFSIEPGDGQVRVRLQPLGEEAARRPGMKDDEEAEEAQSSSLIKKPAEPAVEQPALRRMVQQPAPSRPKSQEPKPAASPRYEIVAPAPSRPTPTPISTPTSTSTSTSTSTPIPSPVQPTLPQASELISMSRAWAQAWSRRDIEDYLAFYASKFQPGKRLTREQWQARRRQRLAAPSFVEVTISEFQTSILSADRATVRFVQDYRSDTLNDHGFKTLELVREGGSWKILRETWSPGGGGSGWRAVAGLLTPMLGGALIH